VGLAHEADQPMKIRLDCNEEFYPVVVESDRWGDLMDVPDELVERVRRVQSEWDEVQRELLAFCWAFYKRDHSKTKAD
jgi:hypothetical protein